MNNNDLQQIFIPLREILLDQAGPLDIVKDEPGELQVFTRHIMKNKKTLYFGGVVINKNYVSFHLMPVYVKPELLANISPELSKCMQGKSCFNFTKNDASLFTELSQLTEKGFESYNQQGYI